MKHIIKDFKSFSGQHCTTTALRHIFTYHGQTISEELLFGLAQGLGFFYGDSKTMPRPFIGFRTQIGEFEKNIANSLNIDIQLYETSSPKKAYSALKTLLLQDQPVMIYVDMPYLTYLNMPKDAHFGGHAIVVFGIDEEEGTAYISDRDDADHRFTLHEDEIPKDFHIITLEELERARNSTFKPFPPKNRYFTFDFQGIKPVDTATLFRAIQQNTEQMLNPPLKNLGVKGIRTCSEKLIDWKDFDDNTLRGSAFSGFISINKTGGTGGGGFRKMYGNFLRESGKLITSERLSSMGDEYWRIGEAWDEIGKSFYHLSQTLDRAILDEISGNVYRLYEREGEFLSRLENFSKP